MEYKLALQLKDKGFPQESEWTVRNPSIEDMVWQNGLTFKVEECYWKNDEWICVGGGTKVSAKDLPSALALLWIQQN